MMYLSQCVLSGDTWCQYCLNTGDVKFDHSAKVGSSRFLHRKLYFSPDTLRICFSYFCPLVLWSIDDSWNTYDCGVRWVVIFIFLHLLMEEHPFSPFPHEFNYIFLLVWTHGHCLLWVITYCYHCHYLNHPRFGHWNPFPCPFISL